MSNATNTSHFRSSQSEQGSLRLAPEIIAKWQLEIRQFATRIRSELARVNEEIISDTRAKAEAGETENRLAVTPHAGRPTASYANGEAEDRLQKIKLRIAAQLENS